MAEPEGDSSNANPVRHTAGKPYSPRNPIPTIGKYKERKAERRVLENDRADADQEGLASDGDRVDDQKPSEIEANSEEAADGNIHGSKNRNANPQAFSNIDKDKDGQEADQNQQEGHESNADAKDAVDTSEVAASHKDPGARGKALKKRDAGDRQVTDPVTHLPTIIHDFTKEELDGVPECLDVSDQPDGRNASQLESEAEDILEGDRASIGLFPPPSIRVLKSEIGNECRLAIASGLLVLWLIPFTTYGAYLLVVRRTENSNLSTILMVGLLIGSVLSALAVIWVIVSWLRKRIDNIWENRIWEASAKQENIAKKAAPESTMWLNSLLSRVWPLVNPDLFTSIADTLEDVMQSSLPPKLVRMVAVDDLGQGAIAPRILGARWLPPGAAGRSVSIDGKTKSKGEDGQSDRKAPGDGKVDGSLASDQSKGDSKQKEEEDQSVSEGLEAESGDFVNLELSLSYRAPGSGQSFKDRVKTAHLHLVFYLTGSIPLPVFVSLRGFLCRVRMRMQLSPDPPFVNLLTMTLMGQPKVDLSCVPITRKLVSLTDLPLISSFVQSSIDAALSEYVSPRSLTINLKQMLEGDDFKKNTNTRGVIMVNIKRGYDFKEADTGIIGIKDASSDAYITVGWAKFGKPLWSTRVILKDMKPVWDETTFVLVGMEEVNANESLRIQLWDSDRMSADDDLGRIEISLKDLMNNMKGSMSDRTDGFMSMEAGEQMPGKLDWAVGYFEKVQITKDQLETQQLKPNLRSLQQLKEQVSKDAKNKVREAHRGSSDEADQQEALGFEQEEDELISASPAPIGYPSGVLSIQIHNITGLSLAALQTDRKSHEEDYEDDSQGNDDLPSSYATIIINNATVYKTRTKPKNAKPFFNAATERFIRDWRATEVIVSVRDRRTHEVDPLLGFVYLPLEQVMKERCQINEVYPLSGGAGYGKVRISLMFRSVELKLPKELLGWERGTLEITGPVTSTNLPEDFQNLRMTIHNSFGKGKLYSSKAGEWSTKKEKVIRLAVSSRYSTNVVIKFRKDQALQNSTVAFAILWLKDIVDDEDQEIKVDVWDGKSDIKRATANCVEEAGDKLGTISVPLKFYSGLSDYHKGMAKQKPDVGHVMEVNDAMNDQQEKSAEFDGQDGDGDTSDSSDSDDEEDKGLQDDGKRDVVSDIKEYKHHHKTLQRKNRGLMQWKVARTGNWLKTKVETGVKSVTQKSFSHHQKDPKIETEA